MGDILRLLSSKWAYAVWITFIIMTTVFRTTTMMIIGGAVLAIMICTILISAYPHLKTASKAWRKFPNTDEYREYADRKAAIQATEQKNKIDIR